MTKSDNFALLGGREYQRAGKWVCGKDIPDWLINSREGVFVFFKKIRTLVGLHTVTEVFNITVG